MEYSLMAILYLVELQIKEGLQSDFIHYKENYPFCNGAEYKKEVFEYLVKYNNESLQRILKNQIEICHSIFDKWNNELRLMNRGLRDVLEYNIYCTFKKNTYFPFEDLELIRYNHNDKIIEHGNINIEDNRWWNYFEKSESDKKFDRNIYGDSVKMTSTHQLVDFASDLWNILTDCITGTEQKEQVINESTKESQQITILDNVLNKLQPYLNVLQEKGFIEDATERHLKWLKSKSLLAYFVDVANDKLSLKKGVKRTIKPFEILFNVSGLTGLINDYKNKTGQKPESYKDIDMIFDNLLK